MMFDDDIPPFPPVAGGGPVQVGDEFVEYRTCSCCTNAKKPPKNPPPRFVVRDKDGNMIAMGNNWRRLCHARGWYPLPGLKLGDKLPRVITEPSKSHWEGELSPSKKRRKAEADAKKARSEPPPLLWDGIA